MALPQNPTPQKALAMARLIWGVMLVGLIVLLIVGFVLGTRNGEAGLGWVSPFVWIALAAAFGVGTFVRNQMFKRHWVGDVVEPSGFITGNIIAWAMIETPTMLSIVLMMIDGIQPHVWPALLGIALFVYTAPSGKPLLGQSNPYQAGPRER